VGQTGTALSNIVGKVEAVTERINHMAEVAKGQAVSLEEVNSAAREFDRATQKNAAMAEEINAATAILTEQTLRLGRMINEFVLDERAPAAKAA